MKTTNKMAIKLNKQPPPHPSQFVTRNNMLVGIIKFSIDNIVENVSSNIWWMVRGKKVNLSNKEQEEWSKSLIFFLFFFLTLWMKYQKTPADLLYVVKQ